jgi:hypothetical protein
MNWPSQAAIAVTAFRVRCMSEKLLDTTGKGYSTPPIDNARARSGSVSSHLKDELAPEMARLA